MLRVVTPRGVDGAVTCDRSKDSRYIDIHICMYKPSVRLYYTKID